MAAGLVVQILRTRLIMPPVQCGNCRAKADLIEPWVQRLRADQWIISSFNGPRSCKPQLRQLMRAGAIEGACVEIGVALECMYVAVGILYVLWVKMCCRIYSTPNVAALG